MRRRLKQGEKGNISAVQALGVASIAGYALVAVPFVSIITTPPTCFSTSRF